MTHRSKSYQSALTFIELIVIVFILSALIALSIPQFRKTGSYYKLDNFTKNIYFLCNYLQSASISETKQHSLNFLANTGEFKSFYLNEDGQWQATKGRFTGSYKTPEGITLEIDPIEKETILFYPDGSIDNVVIVFKDEFGHKRSLNISGLTGDIKIK